MFAGQADARVQEANLTGCAKANTVVFMQKGGLNFLYPDNQLKSAEAPGRGFLLASSNSSYAALTG